MTAIFTPDLTAKNSTLIVTESASIDSPFRGASDAVLSLVADSWSANTRANYSGALSRYLDDCAKQGLVWYEANTLASYIASLHADGKSYSTINVAKSAIGSACEASGFANPARSLLVKQTMKGIGNQAGRAGVKAKALLATNVALQVNKLRLAYHTKGDKKALRDAAILAIGFLGALRRSELVALRVSDITIVTGKGIDVHIRKSKTDQSGDGATIALMQGDAFDVIGVLTDWLALLGDDADASLFRSVDRHGIVRGALTRNGVDVDRLVKRVFGDDYSAHSLRHGAITAAAESGASIDKIQAVSRHKSTAVLLGYVQHADRFKGHMATTFA